MTGVIAVLPTHTFFNNNGTPCANGRLHVIGANTSPPSGNLPSWIDKAQTILNTNPIILDALGQCSLWLEAGQVYDLILKDDPLGANTGTPGATIRTYEDVSGASSALIAPTQWVVTGLTPTFANSRTFTVVGDQTSTYSVGRRVKTLNTGGIKYATIISSVYGTVTTVTLGFQNNTDAIDSGISTADVGLETIVNPALQTGDGSIIDMTGYTGADIRLAIGQSVIYNISSVGAFACRVATSNLQGYRVEVFNGLIGGANFGNSFLQPNNVNQANIFATVIDMSAALTGSQGAASTTMQLEAGGGRTYKLDLNISTGTFFKTVKSEYHQHSAASISYGFVSNLWFDLVTAWTSLGTITFGSSVTGKVVIKRLY